MMLSFINDFISNGTPGKKTKTVLFFCNHNPGALPLVFKKTWALEGTRDWSILTCKSGCLIYFFQINLILSKTLWSVISLSLKNLSSVFLVISSLVGPKPPVTITISE